MVFPEKRMDHKETSGLQTYLKEKKAYVDAALQKYAPSPQGPASRLMEAMRYSLFADGKRLRPILCIAGCEAVDGAPERVLPVACALEFIHAYSLIHDDLPLMDDDDVRRGQPTNHKVFGDAVALLAGDALLTEAFHLMAGPDQASLIPAPRITQAIQLIAEAAGFDGMVGGQAVDILSEHKPADLDLVNYMHTHKTGALITASVVSGALLAGADDLRLKAMESYGSHIGLAFQISDDILDIEGDARAMGKNTGADQVKGKMTYPAVLGMAAAKKIESELIQKAILALKPFDHKADPLRQIAQYIIERKR